MLASGGFTYEKPLTFLRSGAKPGDEWDYTYTRAPTSFHNHLKVVGPERVEVALADVLIPTQVIRGIEQPAGRDEGAYVADLQLVALV